MNKGLDNGLDLPQELLSVSDDTHYSLVVIVIILIVVLGLL